MAYKSKLILIWHFAICLEGNNISVIYNSTTWHDALKHCAQLKLRLADIFDITTYKSCENRFHQNEKKTYWVGNFYKLSSRISVQGCYNISNQKAEVGYKHLYDCFYLCVGRMKTGGLFAHKAVLEPQNCICDPNQGSGLPTNLKMDNAIQCSSRLPFWWVYKVHLNDLNTEPETCLQFTCTDFQDEYRALRENICGQHSNTEYHDLRTPIPQDKVPYICDFEKNATKRTFANETMLAGYFRFGQNASVKSDPIEKPAVAFKCKSISCTGYYNFDILLQNCSSTTFGFFCVNVTGNSHESRNESSTIGISSPMTFAISKSLNTPPKGSQHHESTSSTTESKIITQSNQTYQRHTSVGLSNSSQDNIYNSQVHVVTTSPVRSSAKQNSKTTRFHTTPSMIYSSLHTSTYATVHNEMNILESTAGISEAPLDSHSKIGLIVGSLVAAIVIIVAVGFIVFFRLRRQGPLKMKKFVDDIQINELTDSKYQDIDNGSNQESRDVHNTMYDIHTNNEFGPVDVGLNSSTNIRNNEYAVVVKNNQSGNQVVEQKCDTKGEDSDDLLESEYDRLNHVRTRSGKDPSNIYDSALGFREDSDATYNTTVCRGIDKGDDSVYDHA